MSRIYDHLKSLEARIAQEKVGRQPGDQRGMHEDLLRLVTAERAGQEYQLRSEELEIQVHILEAAIERADRRAAENGRLAEEFDAQLAEVTRLEVLARERIQAEQTERGALAARIEVERLLAAKLEVRIEQEKIERAQAAQRAAHEEQLRSVVAEREEQERLLRAEEQAARMRLHEAAIEESRKRAVEEKRRAEEYAVQLEQEARLEAFARERVLIELSERAALAARIEAERQLAAQIEARIEQEMIERAQASRRAAHEEQLRIASAARQEQECQLRIEELAAQSCSHEDAIEEARKRAAEETRRTEQVTLQLAEETRLERLARERTQIEQSERLAIAARIEAERQLAVQIEARIEQEKLNQEQLTLRVAQEEKLRLATAEREAQELRLQAEECAANFAQEARMEAVADEHKAEVQAAGVAVRTIITTARSVRDRMDGQVTSARPTFSGVNRRNVGFLVVILMVIGGVFFVVAGSRVFDNLQSAALVRSGGDTAPSSVKDTPFVSTVRTAVPAVPVTGGVTNNVPVKPRQEGEAEIRRAVLQWADAWSRRDAGEYLSFYADDFILPEGMRRTDWEAQRQSRLSKYSSIKVTLKNMKINYSGGDIASVHFAQDFRADSYREIETQKELQLKNVRGRWFIVVEKNS